MPAPEVPAETPVDLQLERSRAALRHVLREVRIGFTFVLCLIGTAGALWSVARTSGDLLGEVSGALLALLVSAVCCTLIWVLTDAPRAVLEYQLPAAGYPTRFPRVWAAAAVPSSFLTIDCLLIVAYVVGAWSP